MKFKFPNSGTALGFCDGLSDPDGLDVYASPEDKPDDNIVEVLGLDDHETMAAQIAEYALAIGGEKLP